MGEAYQDGQRQHPDGHELRHDQPVEALGATLLGGHRETHVVPADGRDQRLDVDGEQPVGELDGPEAQPALGGVRQDEDGYEDVRQEMGDEVAGAGADGLQAEQQEQARQRQVEHGTQAAEVVHSRPGVLEA